MMNQHMKAISEAKKLFGELYRSEEGVVGVGIGRIADAYTLQVYVENADAPIARKLKSESTFEGFPVVVKVAGKFRAFSA